MKRFLLSLVIATSLTLTSCQFDDSDIWDKLNEHEEAIKDHEQRIDNSNQLTSDQKSKLKNLYNEIADNVKDYCQESLRIEGRLVD